MNAVNIIILFNYFPNAALKSLPEPVFTTSSTLLSYCKRKSTPAKPGLLLNVTTTVTSSPGLPLSFDAAITKPLPEAFSPLCAVPPTVIEPSIALTSTSAELAVSEHSLQYQFL